MTSGITGHPELLVIEKHFERVDIDRLPELTELPIVMPTHWGAEDVRVTAGVLDLGHPYASRRYRDYRVDAVGARALLTVAVGPARPSELTAREDQEPLDGAELPVRWSSNPAKLHGSALVPLADEADIAAGVTVVADGLTREAFADVLRSLRVLSG